MKKKLIKLLEKRSVCEDDGRNLILAEPPDIIELAEEIIASLGIDILTLQKLKELPPGVFATGTGTYPELHHGPIRWVAVRGGIHDWALYYHHEYHTMEYVRDHGDKSFTKRIIRELVPCDDEAWEMYRF